ncbi:MAG: glycosyltransferase [Acidobacteriota bacterium]
MSVDTQAPRAEPLFSVVVPTYGRPEQLVACVRSLARLDYSRRSFEIVIVDDGSPESPEEAVRSVDPDLSLRVVRQENAGPAMARNHGARLARGRYVAFVDDDCRPRESWLRALEGALEDDPESLVGGRIENALSRNLCSEASQLLVSFLYEYFDGSAGRPRMFCSNNLALARARFLESGGFDESMRRAAAEDRELCDRWHFRGKQLRYVEDAVVDHHHRMGLRKYWRQHFNYGRGAYLFHRIRQRDQRGALRPEPPSFYVRLLTYPLRRGLWPRNWALSALLFIAQVANVGGFAAELRAARHDEATGGG